VQRNYHKYDPSLIKGNYDVAIIGSGLAGLTAGVLLAKAGKRVLILERHFKPGGFTHTFKRQNYEWDVGVHYVGQVNNPKSMMSRLFDIVSEGDLLWEDMGDVYDQAIIDGKTFNFRKGKENLKSDLKERFPDEHSAIDKYFALLKQAELSAGLFFGERTMPPFMSKTIGYFLRRKFQPFCQKNTLATLKEITLNTELIAVLATQCGNYGLAPNKSSFAMHTTIAGHYMDGAAYPQGGAFKIYESLSDKIVSRGGEIYVNAEVDSIVTKGKRIDYLLMKDGSKVKAKNYISNAGLHNTYNKLIKKDKHIKKYKRALNQISSSTSHLCFYGGFTNSDKALGFPKHNIWVYNSTDFSSDHAKFMSEPEGEIPLFYFSFPSAKDKIWQDQNPDRATIQIVVPANYDWFEKWNDSKWKKRPEDYQDFKLMFKEKILKELFKHFPACEAYLDHAELSTPLTTEHFSNYSRGEIYGLEHTPKRFMQRWIRVYTPYNNLYLTGQDILTVGVGGALFSGAFAAFGILRLKLLNVIRKAVKH